MSVHSSKRGNCVKPKQRKRVEPKSSTMIEDLTPKLLAPMKPRITTFDLLEELEAEFVRLKAQNRRLIEQLDDARKKIALLEKEVQRPAQKSVPLRKPPAVAPTPAARKATPEQEPVLKKRVLGKTLADLQSSRRRGTVLVAKAREITKTAI